MPVAAAVAPLVGSVGSAIVGGIAGGANARPPSLSPQQQQAQNTDIQAATKSATGPVTIDPTQQTAIYDNIARSTAGANAASTNAAASRGLGRSGVLASNLQQNQDVAAASQNQANLSLEQQALQNQQFNRSLLSQLTQTPNIPGQSTTGAVTAGAAGPLAYALQQQALKQQQQPQQTQNYVLPTDPNNTGSQANYQ